jgi:hypothetical protein
MTPNHFQFTGFEPSKYFSDAANHTLHQMLELVPTDVSHSAYFTKVDNQYECRLELFSHSGKFIAESLNDDAEVALQNVNTQVREFIEKWHATRFVDPKSDLWPFALKHEGADTLEKSI